MTLGRCVRPLFSLMTLLLVLSACGSGGGSNTTGTPEDANAFQQVSADDVLGEQAVTVSGLVSYERVPFEGRSYTGLDYDAMYTNPIRGVTVQAITASGNLLTSTQTDDTGFYSFKLPESTDLKIRIVAELASPDAAQWLIQVRDNTSNNALYVLEGSLVGTGNKANQTRNLHAASGWVNSAYTEERSAGPFAILSSVYDALILVTEAAPNMVLPALDIFWSPNNVAVSGNVRNGHIGTSFYSTSGPAIYLLGAANSDSDEYDRGVVQHEFGHYLEHEMSRSESLGGSHNMNSKLDIRVAFGEAWGNAFAGMASGDPIYRDSLGSRQELGFIIDVDDSTPYNKGWYSEASIQAILFDLFDGTDDEAGDNIELGFKPLYDILTSDAYADFEGFASIYAFIDLLKHQAPEHAAAITDLMHAQNIFGTGMYGENETNDANAAILLPVYNSIHVGQTINVCSDKRFQSYNGIDIRRLVKFTVPAEKTYQFTIARKGGAMSRTQPRMNIYQRGQRMSGSNRTANDMLSANRRLSAGTYILEIYEATNIEHGNGGGLACFDVRVN